MHPFWYEEIQQFFAKWSTHIVGTAIGVIGKISYELGVKRQLNIWQWFGIVGVSIFCGYMTGVLCDARGWGDHARYLIPISTLLGEKILIYITNNYVEFFNGVLAIFTKKK